MGSGLSKSVAVSSKTPHTHISKHKVIRVSAAQPRPPHVSSEPVTNNGSPNNVRRRSSAAPRRLSMFDVTVNE